MRFKLLRRRLTISAPRMAVRSALPWPFRWAVIAIVFGFCAAIGLWAFEFGKEIAGLERGSKEEVTRLRQELMAVKADLDKTRESRDEMQRIANTAGTLVTTEKAAQEQLVARAQKLETENQRLRDDLGFFEKLIPTPGTDGVAIRGVQAELVSPGVVKWQVLVLQASKNAPEFAGKLEMNFAGTLNGKAWASGLTGGAMAVTVRQYGRLEGEFEVPPQVILKSVAARLLDTNGVRSTQVIKL